MKTLSLIEKAFFLKKISLFNVLDLDLLIAIAEKMHQDEYPSNEKVFEKGQLANRMYFIIDGEIDLLDENNMPIATCSKTDFFGEESLFSDKPRSYNAVCKIDTAFLTLTKTNLMTIISECPTVAIALLQCHCQNVTCRFQNEHPV
ncbi:MAG: cyclic nucleotide-binding domain-containing protein [Chlamydiae bacterium]|nr:cyclic nucleotide-binding domain-containing protein [Chlamydiota bacterium]